VAQSFVGLVLGSVVLAQDAASVVGAISYPVGQNRMITVGVPLLRPAIAAGVVEAADAEGLTVVDGEGIRKSLAGLLADESSYFVEVVGHSAGAASEWIGHRLEVDEQGSRSNPAGKIALADSSLNTLAKSTLSQLSGHRVVVRPHWTLATVFGTGSTANLNSSSSPAEADQVYFSTANGLSVFYFRKGTTPQWRSLSGGAGNQDGAIIPPGVGVFFKRQGTSAVFTITGEVRATRFIRSPASSGQLLVSGFPVAASPADLRLVNGLTAATSPAAADQLLRWNGSSFESFFLQSGSSPVWRKESLESIDFTSSKLLDAASAVLLRLRAGPTSTLAQAVPFSL